MTFFLRGDFFIKNNKLEYDFSGIKKLSPDFKLENNNLYNLSEIKNRAQYLGVSNSDFELITHWYWFGYRRLEMTDSGRQLYVKEFVSNSYSSLEVLKKFLWKVWKIAKRYSLNGLIAFIIIAIAFILINFTTLYLSTKELKSYYYSAAYIGYYALTGTIVAWGHN